MSEVSALPVEGESETGADDDLLALMRIRKMLLELPFDQSIQAAVFLQQAGQWVAKNHPDSPQRQP